MKIAVTSARKQKSHIKCIYMVGPDSYQPELRSITVDGDDLKETLMEFADSIDLPYLGLDFEEPDEFGYQDLIDAIVYNNENRGEYDYIFKLEVNGKVVINNTSNIDI